MSSDRAKEVYCLASLVVTHFLSSYVSIAYTMPSLAAAVDFYQSMWWTYASAFAIVLYGAVTPKLKAAS